MKKLARSSQASKGPVTAPTNAQGLLQTGLAAFIRAEARRQGFQAVGFTSAAAFADTEAVLLQRIDGGLLAGLPWFNAVWAHRSCTPQALLPGVRSLVTLAASYHDGAAGAPPPADGTGYRGRIARYARGGDYHKLLKAKVRQLAAAIATELGCAVGSRVFVDVSPMPERAAARRSGLGWVGKNTQVMVKGIGSWVLLAVLALDVDLPEGEPLATHCGACDLCLRACPTGALVDAYTLDNDRCISYQTIENRGDIPPNLRPLMGDWVFGCDICQDVCPVNRHAAATAMPELASRSVAHSHPLLTDLLQMDEATYTQRFRGTAIKRAKRSGLQRNAAIALGNAGDPAAVPALATALTTADPLVRRHAAWALGRIGAAKAVAALRAALSAEADASVLAEIVSALSEAERPMGN